MARLVIGGGYLGLRVARRWVEAGPPVYVVTRSEGRAAQFAELGLCPIVADITHPATLAALPRADTVLFAVGHDPASGRSIHEVLVEGLEAVLDALPPDTGRFIYISSTGVYGDAGGSWIKESTACRPRRESGKAHLAAELRLASHHFGSRAITLRMAGLYGPGRLPRAEALRRGEPIVASGEAYINLVHVDDAVEVILLAEQRGIPPRTYLVADGHPVLRRDFYAQLARLLGTPPPVFSPGGARPASARGEESKRVSIQRLAEELAPRFQYPSYVQGLAAIAAEMRGRQAAPGKANEA